MVGEGVEAVGREWRRNRPNGVRQWTPSFNKGAAPLLVDGACGADVAVLSEVAPPLARRRRSLIDMGTSSDALAQATLRPLESTEWNITLALRHVSESGPPMAEEGEGHDDDDTPPPPSAPTSPFFVCGDGDSRYDSTA